MRRAAPSLSRRQPRPTGIAITTVKVAVGVAKALVGAVGVDGATR